MIGILGTRLSWAHAGIVLLLAGMTACGGGDAPPDRSENPLDALQEADVPARVFLVGVDAGNWKVFEPAMRLGVMPNLARMVEEGAHGPLKSMDPTSSAIIWTTLATGKTPDKHGILGFVAPSESGRPVPVSSNMRRTKAVWNIASEAGVTVGFLGWWVSWPAEPVRGFMATDYTWPLLKDHRGFATGVDPALDVPRRTYPDDLLDELQPFIKSEFNTSEDDMYALGISAIPSIRGYAVRDMLLKDISLGDMTGYLLERYDPSLFAVYFDGFDAYCHIFWPVFRDYLSAREEGDDVVANMDFDKRGAGEAMELHLARLDAYLGAVLAHAGPDDVVMVISDHGYGDNPGNTPILRGFDEWIEPPHWHTLEGFVAAIGGPVRAGFKIEDANVLDVTPTVLALLGLPVADDMDGKPLTGLLKPGFLLEHPLQSVPTYDTEEWSEQQAIESPYDEEVLDRLRNLGYLD